MSKPEDKRWSIREGHIGPFVSDEQGVWPVFETSDKVALAAAAPDLYRALVAVEWHFESDVEWFCICCQGGRAQSPGAPCTQLSRRPRGEQ